MLPIFKRVEFVLTSDIDILRPLDISEKGDIFVHRAFTETGGVSLYHSKLSKPTEKRLTLPEGLASHEARLSSDDRWTLTAVDYDGSENHHLCRLPTEGLRNIDDVRRCAFKKIRPHRIVDYVWAPTDDSVLYFSAGEKQQHVSLVSNDLEAEPEPVLENVFGFGLLDWKHPDLAYFLGSRTAAWKEGLMTIFNPNTHEIVVEQDCLMSAWFSPRWQSQGPSIPVLLPDSIYGRLSILDANTLELRTIPQPDGEISFCHWSLDGGTLYVGATKNGRSTVSSVVIDGDEIEQLDLMVGMTVPWKLREWNDSETLFYTHSSASRPIDLWAYDIESRTQKKVTSWHDPAIGTEAFPVVESKSIHYSSSYDSMSIHGFLLLPSNPPPKEGYPLIVWIHGGPTAQYFDDFDALFQIFAQEGFAVFASNYRGSTGYGEEFMQALFQKAGKADLVDVSSGADYIVKNYPINPKKVGIGGGSYGGYMTLAALAFQPARWAAGYARVPIADWTYLYDYGDAMFKEYIEYMWGDPLENRNLMLERSPISKVDDIRAPLAIFQTANDSRTPLPPVLKFANRLYARNHDLSLTIEPGAGHMSRDKYTTIRELVTRVHFFKKKLQEETL